MPKLRLKLRKSKKNIETCTEMIKRRRRTLRNGRGISSANLIKELMMSFSRTDMPKTTINTLLLMLMTLERHLLKRLMILILIEAPLAPLLILRLTLKRPQNPMKTRTGIISLSSTTRNSWPFSPLEPFVDASSTTTTKRS